MSVNIYFVNETKKQIVETKLLYGGLEDSDALACYLSFSEGDTIKVMTEYCDFIEKSIMNEEFKYIYLYEFDFYNKRKMEIERMHKLISNK
jgi:hypothetical protein